MTVISKYSFLNDLNLRFNKNINFVFIFGSKSDEFIIVTKTDEVYGFGKNKFCRLGLGHQYQINEPTIILELCHKKVVDIVNGWRHVIALTSDGKIYRWGHNWSESFSAREYEQNNIEQSKPKLVQSLKEEFVIDISCGSIHSLALTKSGKVYAWGCNKWGQLGNGNHIDQLCKHQVNKILSYTSFLI
jgi:alpha-tubulin suppressor-like RCC1 family protein